MMTVMVTPETARIEVREGFSLALPKFLWRVMEARAQALHDGDLKATMTELVAEELLRWFKESIRGGKGGVMSHYSEVMIELTDEGCLVAALNRLGFEGKVEVHREAQPLYGYQGDVRSQKAHIIIRRQHVGGAANDLGFERQPDGKYRVWVSEFDQRQNGYGDAWLGKLKQAYGVEKARLEAKKRGYRVSEQKLDDGRIRLVLRR